MAIDALEQAISGGIHYVGVTTTEMYDGLTTANVTINGTTYTPNNGDMVSYEGKEFLWSTAITPSAWQELGSTGSLGQMAFVDKGVIPSYTPAGYIPQTTITATGGTTDVVLGEATTFSGASSDVTFDTTTSGNTAAAITALPTATVPKTSSTTKYLKPTTTDGDAITALPSATVPKTSSTSKYLTASTTTANAVTAMPTATVPKPSGTKKYLATTSVTPFGSAGTLPTFESSVTNETLSFSFSQGTLASAGTAVNVATGRVAASASGTETTDDQVVTAVSTSGTNSVTFGTPTTAAFVQTVGLDSSDSTSTGAVSYVSSVSTSGTDTVTFGNPTTAKFLKSVGLDSSSSTSTGAVSYISAVSTSGTNSVTFGTPTTATVLTSAVTATAAGQTVTPSTTDKVTVYKSSAMPTYKLPQTNLTGTTAQNIEVNPKTT